jgi:hypothetical protein
MRPTLSRQAVGILSVAAIAVTVFAAKATRATATPLSSAEAGAPDNDAWLDRLTGSHRQLFDAPTPAGGVPLVHLMNYYDTYNKAYGAKDTDVNGILTFYGTTTFYGLSDAMWAKYRLGEFLETTDPRTNQPATANPWRIAPVALGGTLPQADMKANLLPGVTVVPGMVVAIEKAQGRGISYHRQ